MHLYNCRNKIIKLFENKSIKPSTFPRNAKSEPKPVLFIEKIKISAKKETLKNEAPNKARKTICNSKANLRKEIKNIFPKNFKEGILKKQKVTLI